MFHPKGHYLTTAWREPTLCIIQRRRTFCLGVHVACGHERRAVGHYKVEERRVSDAGLALQARDAADGVL